ncbi:cell envelope integrity TolA family protein [Vibrio parahaemolyticus]|uniref:cell envelope integrity protein TolA n=1 Tax=Vibrio parahaemolyticus TaxID=670 RepID=UPI002269EFBE|nr:cell envelope integrity protein TolA [Vibrio parahaemolyticus]MCX8905839.1 cell envelope integrity protein TolA [Vibrio parahaemolyticus]
MKKVRWAFLTCLFVSIASTASSKAEREVALNEIFKGLSNGTEDSVTSRYASKYVGLINEQLGELKNYKGLDCRVKVSLSSNGSVEHVELANQNVLCRKVFNSVWDIGSFPLPSDITEANKLREFGLSIAPE